MIDRRGRGQITPTDRHLNYFDLKKSGRVER
jgi:hypothetical protein